MERLGANYIADCQLKWAAQEKVPIEGYTKRVEDNIFNNELHPETKKEYEKGKGHELDGKRAHMKALHSSSALVVNIFDYWRRQNRIQDIARCCGAEGVVGMEFEKTHPIKGMDRTPPHLDIEFAGLIPWLLSQNSPRLITEKLEETIRIPTSIFILNILIYGMESQRQRL